MGAGLHGVGVRVTVVSVMVGLRMYVFLDMFSVALSGATFQPIMTSNRRYAAPPGAGRQFGHAVHAPPCSPAAVGERWALVIITA